MIPTKLINDLLHKVNKDLSLKITLFQGSSESESIVENILSPSFFYTIAYIYRDLLDNFYNMQYLVSHYIRVAWGDLLNMTPIETTILYKNFIEDKEKQNEKNNADSVINLNDPNIADSINYYG